MKRKPSFLHDKINFIAINLPREDPKDGFTLGIILASLMLIE